MENWRLSRIEEELGKLKLDLSSIDFAEEHNLILQTDEDCLKSPDAKESDAKESDSVVGNDDDDNICKGIVIHHAYKRKSRGATSNGKTEADDAVKIIKEKYDSPNAITMYMPTARGQLDVAHHVVLNEPVSLKETVVGPHFGLFLPDHKTPSQDNCMSFDTSKYLRNCPPLRQPKPIIAAKKPNLPLLVMQIDTPLSPQEADESAVAAAARSPIRPCRAKEDSMRFVVEENSPPIHKSVSAQLLKTAESERHELVLETLQKIHVANNNSNNHNYPQANTMRLTNSNSSAIRFGDLYPPSRSLFTDEDRHQVEMFYRSHKTQVFVARSEANLYFGSARRHSIIASTRSGSSQQSNEKPENWVLLKRGLPVLVLDSGDGRRRRRLYVILAERGTGFTLWRDSVDHLTSYSTGSNASFHTMHLSKDHTKLAGFYFADPTSANEFIEYLRRITSDPEDSLLDLSNGARKRKDQKKKIKEKRKPFRREDISLPCCFDHITKLDRNDGLSILESDDHLLQDKIIDCLLEENASCPSLSSPSSTPPPPLPPPPPLQQSIDES